MGAMALAVASELFYGESLGDMDKNKREFGDKCTFYMFSMLNPIFNKLKFVVT